MEPVSENKSDEPEAAAVSTRSPFRARVSAAWRWTSKLLSAKEWAGIGVLVAVVGLFGWNQLSQDDAPAPDDPKTTTAASGTPSPAEAALDCLAYNGSEAELSVYSDYKEADFEPVDCVKPHQFEVVPRTSDVTYNDAFVKMVDLYAVPGFKRHYLVDFGPTACAVGRLNGDILQTDTYRITAATDTLPVFGACIMPENVDAYLAGRADYGHNVPCKTGTVLTTYQVVSEGSTPDEQCASFADSVPNRGIRVAPSTMVEDGADPVPTVRCAFALFGVPEA